VLRRRVAGVMTASLNSLRGFYGEGALPGTMSQRFFASDRGSGGPSWSEEAVEYLERRGEFNG
jgi:hypothetical protein